MSATATSSQFELLLAAAINSMLFLGSTTDWEDAAQRFVLRWTKLNWHTITVMVCVMVNSWMKYHKIPILGDGHASIKKGRPIEGFPLTILHITCFDHATYVSQMQAHEAQIQQ
jgi:hypothetical protein